MELFTKMKLLTRIFLVIVSIKSVFGQTQKVQAPGDTLVEVDSSFSLVASITKESGDLWFINKDTEQIAVSSRAEAGYVLPAYTSQYSVTVEAEHVNLTFLQAPLTASGLYQWEIFGTGIKGVCKVIIVEVEDVVLAEVLVADVAENFTCAAKYNTYVHNLPEDDAAKPILWAMLDGNRQDPESHSSATENDIVTVTEVYNITLQPDHHEHNFTCQAVRNGNHDEKVEKSKLMEVLYAPIKMLVSDPSGDSGAYETGHTINCSADGNPVPEMSWYDDNNNDELISGPTMSVVEALLEESMIENPQMWTCKATNTVAGQARENSLLASFTVVQAGTTVPPAPPPKDNTATIAASVTVVALLLIILAVVGIILFTKRRKMQKEADVKSSNSMSKKVPTGSQQGSMSSLQEGGVPVVNKSPDPTYDNADVVHPSPYGRKQPLNEPAYTNTAMPNDEGQPDGIDMTYAKPHYQNAPASDHTNTNPGYDGSKPPTPKPAHPDTFV